RPGFGRTGQDDADSVLSPLATDLAVGPMAHPSPNDTPSLVARAGNARTANVRRSIRLEYGLPGRGELYPLGTIPVRQRVVRRTRGRAHTRQESLLRKLARCDSRPAARQLCAGD